MPCGWVPVAGCLLDDQQRPFAVHRVTNGGQEVLSCAGAITTLRGVGRVARPPANHEAPPLPRPGPASKLGGEFLFERGWEVAGDVRRLSLRAMETGTTKRIEPPYVGCYDSGYSFQTGSLTPQANIRHNPLPSQ